MSSFIFINVVGTEKCMLYNNEETTIAWSSMSSPFFAFVQVFIATTLLNDSGWEFYDVFLSQEAFNISHALQGVCLLGFFYLGLF